jgi:hypothetical protein
MRGLVWDSIDLEKKRLFVEHHATRLGADETANAENSARTVPVPDYELKGWNVAWLPIARGLVLLASRCASPVEALSSRIRELACGRDPM